MTEHRWTNSTKVATGVRGPLHLALIVLAMLGTAYLSALPGGPTPSRGQAPGPPVGAAGLPLPSSLPLQDYERLLYRFLFERSYASQGWAHDKGVRDTGPYIENQYFGTHPAVRVYYSPEVIDWLTNDRDGEIPDGAMIVKEMFAPPALLYQALVDNPSYANPDAYQALLARLVSAWTVMVRDRQASHDGWFWAGPGAPGASQTTEEAISAQLDTLTAPPGSEFGAPCLRCHGSAERESTFSDLRNIEGFLPDREPLRFFVDTSWRSASHFATYPLSILAGDPWVQSHFMLPTPLRPFSAGTLDAKDVDGDFHTGLTRSGRVAGPEGLRDWNPEFVAAFPGIAPPQEIDVQTFPSQWMDHVVPRPGVAKEFVTSNNCLGCHGGLGGEPYGVTMFAKTGPAYGDGFNLSEYGEWRWSPMGLAGRDPIFFAQLESEMALLERDATRRPTPLVGSLLDNQQAVTNTCLSCHGAMGQRQLTIDARQDPSLDPNFKVEYMFLEPRLMASHPVDPSNAYVEYGQLGRDGISCAVCHQIDAPHPERVAAWTPAPSWLSPTADRELAYQLFHNNTGRFDRGPTDELFGPFDDVRVKAMENAIGLTPVHNTFTSDSQLCATCHTINLPNIGATEHEFPVLDAAEQNPALQPYPHSIEQATFLEWQNSAFAEGKGEPASGFASCQDCHMPRGFTSADGQVDIDTIVTKIAAIQDADQPEADNLLPMSEIDVPLRDGYRRHEHVGLNVFLLEMFDQFPQILGVDKKDYMTSADNGVDTAIDNMVLQAQDKTLDVDVTVNSFVGTALEATVTLTNKTGHRFPSGVAFRRAFIELLVLDGDEVVWGSGRTNGVGMILDGEGRPLPTELLPDANTYQMHHQRITSEDQVQIYEELNQNAQHEFTTSFIHRVYPIKDNRLLPKGWRAAENLESQGEVLFEFFKATDPHGTGADLDYRDQGPGFPGRDSLVYDVTLPRAIDPARLEVRATVYYQAIPPSFLHERFTTAPDGPATRRLYFLTSHLDLGGTPMADWKLRLRSAAAGVPSLQRTPQP